MGKYFYTYYIRILWGAKKMFKRKRKEKTRLKLNETLNRHLDSMEDEMAMEVFKPKEDEAMVFMNLVNDAMIEEEKQKGSKSKNKRIVVKDASFILSKGVTVVLTIVLIFGFLGFLYWIWSLLF